METILCPHFFPSISNKPSFSKIPLPSKSSTIPKPIVITTTPSLIHKEQFTQTLIASSSPIPATWFSYVRHSLATLTLSLALNSAVPIDSSVASEFDVLKVGPPTQTYVVDDAGVLTGFTKSELKGLLSDLESRKNLHLNFVTVRKLTSKADAFEYADEVLERWYPTKEEGDNKGVVVLVTTKKEGAITGGSAFIKAVGDTVIDSTVSENLPVLATEEKYNEAILGSARRLVAAIDGLPDPGGPKFKENRRESNFKTRQETDEKRGQYTLVVVGLLVIAFVVPMLQYYAYVSKK